MDISVIIPVGLRTADPKALYDGYKNALTTTGLDFEMIFVVDGANHPFHEELRQLLDAGEPFSIVGLARPFGESVAIMAGLENSCGKLILTLPAYHQVEAADIPRLIDGMETFDLAVGRRWPRRGNIIDRFRRTVFHASLAAVTGLRFHDLGCGARCFDRKILSEIQLYGEQHRYLALLADRRGFHVGEIDLRQSIDDFNRDAYTPRDYIRSLLDLITVFFLTRFTKRPLRFFGTAGAITASLGSVIISWLVFERLVYGLPLAERPALILASLLVVLGLQTFALGLLGELIIFTHSKELRDFQIQRIVRQSDHDFDDK